MTPEDSTDPLPTPTLVPIGPATNVTAGYGHTCALETDGTVMCWGGRHEGALGDGLPDDESIAGPVQVAGLTDVTMIRSSWQTLNCALRRSGEVSCWGTDLAVEAGDTPRVFDDSATLHATPVPVTLFP